MNEDVRAAETCTMTGMLFDLQLGFFYHELCGDSSSQQSLLRLDFIDLLLFGRHVVTARHVPLFFLVVGRHALQVGALELLEHHLVLRLTAHNSNTA